MNFKEYKISDFLKRIKRPIKLIDDLSYKLVTIKMNHNGVVLRENKIGALIKSNMNVVKEGDFILSGIDARNGAFGIVPKELMNAIVTNDFWYFEIDKSIIDKHFFLYLTSTNWFDEICKRGSDGTTQRVRLQKDKFFNQKINLPSINEQQMLLEKFEISNEKENQFTEEIKKQKQLIKKLKQSILKEALEGKLTRNWRNENPNVETGSKLLARIKLDKAQLVKDKKLKKEKVIPSILKNEIPFELPESWIWCYVSDIASLTTGDSINKDIKDSKYRNLTKGYDYIGTKDVGFDNQITYNNGVKIPKEETQFSIAKRNSILICIEGGSSGKKMGILDKDVCFGNKLLASHFNHQLNPFFYNLVYKSLLFEEEFKSKSKGLRGGLALNEFKTIKLPLPPIAEQNYLTEIIKTQFANCDKLLDQILNTEAIIKHLLKSVLKEAFEIKEQVQLLNSLFVEKNYNIYLAMAVKIIENRFRIGYGEVALQKTVFNLNSFTDEKIPYSFQKSNYGTFSFQLKEDLTTNQYLTKEQTAKGDVFKVKSSKEKEILDEMLKAVNKPFLRALNEVLEIYEMPFIAKGTDKIELLNTVARLIIDLKTTNLENIYNGMKNWEIVQKGFKTKADKFSKTNTEKMIALIEAKGLRNKLLSV